MTDEELVELAGLLGWDPVDGEGFAQQILWPEQRSDWKPLAWLLTGDGMLAILTRMGEMGYDSMVSAFTSGKSVASFFDEVIGRVASQYADTLPEAVAGAALRALRGVR